MLQSFANGRLFGARWGTGPLDVLALHGWRRSHADFAEVFDDPVFGARHAAVAVDLPGFGVAPPPPERWGTAEYASLLVPLLDEVTSAGSQGRSLGGSALTVVGHSFGGRVALELVRQAPERIGRLVLTGVPLVPSDRHPVRPDRSFRLIRRLHRLGLLGDERMEKARKDHGSPDYRAAEGVMRQVFVQVVGERYDTVMRTVACPVDLVWGRDDVETPVGVAEAAAAIFPAATLTVLPGVGHLTVVEAPSAIREVVLRSVAADGRDGGA